MALVVEPSVSQQELVKHLKLQMASQLLTQEQTTSQWHM
jgi:hypothetical protein